MLPHGRLKTGKEHIEETLKTTNPVLYLLAPVRIEHGVSGVLIGTRCWTGMGYHDGLAISPKRFFQNSRELGVSVVDVV